MGGDLDDLIRMARVDRSDMTGAIGRFPDHFLEINKHSNDVEFASRRPDPQNLVLMGMGGSASAADVALDWFRDEIEVPAIVQREPHLPGFVDSNTLFIAISYSGQTSETLSAFQEARRRGSNLVGIGAGGKLASICRSFNVPFVGVTPAIAPRAALGQLIVATANALEALDLVHRTSRGMLNAGKELVRLRTRVKKETPLANNPAKRLARKLQARFTVAYSLQRMSSVARRFKNQLAENSKVAAKYDVLPEAGHNEVEAWHPQGLPLLPLIIRDWKESRFETDIVGAFSSTIRSASHTEPVEVRLRGQNRLSRLLLPIFFLDYVSVYLAVLRNVDPTPTPLIDEYKKR